MRNLIRAAILLAVASASGTSSAAPPGPVYRLTPDVDVPLLVVPAALSTGWFLSSELAPPHCAPRCRREDVNFLDRPAAGFYDKGWFRASDVAVATTLLSMPAFLFAGESPANAAKDFVVLGETALVASATQVIVSLASSRPRPYVYGDAAPVRERTDGGAARSFFSGHTAICFAATVATSTTLERAGRRDLAWASLGIGLGGSLFQGVGRVASGAHFPTDVLVGAAVGAGIGMLVPALHPRKGDGPEGGSSVEKRAAALRFDTVHIPLLAGPF